MSPKWEGQGPRAIKRLSLLARRCRLKIAISLTTLAQPTTYALSTYCSFSVGWNRFWKNFFLIIYKDLKNTSVLSYQLNTWTVQCENIQIYISNVIPMWEYSNIYSNEIPMWEYSNIYSNVIPMWEYSNIYFQCNSNVRIFCKMLEPIRLLLDILFMIFTCISHFFLRWKTELQIW